MPYTRDFTIGPKETLRFYLTLELERWRKGVLAFGGAGALAGVMYALNGGLGTAGTALAALAGAALGAGLCALWRVLAVYFSVGRKLKGRASYVQSVTVDGAGVRVTAGGNAAKVPFGKILRVRETASALYVFLAANQAWILPKAQMEDPEAECAALREVFRKTIPSGQLRMRK